MTKLSLSGQLNRAGIFLWICFFVAMLLGGSVLVAAGGVSLLPGGFVAPADAETTSPIARPTQRRGKAIYKLLAEPESNVRLDVNAIQVGKYTDNISITVKDAQGQTILKETVVPKTQKQLTFQSPGGAGLLTIECRAGKNAVALSAQNARLLLPIHRQTLNIIKHANPLYFYVEKDARRFELMLTGQGDLETAQAVVRTPDGNVAASVSTVESGIQQATIKVPPGADAAVWSVQIGKASQGVFEDCSFRLSGPLGYYAAESAADLVVDALYVDAPILVRPEERRDLAAKAFVVACLRQDIKDLIFSIMDEQDNTVASVPIDPRHSKPWNPFTGVPAGNYELVLAGRIGTKQLSARQPLFIVDRPANLTADKTTLIGGKPFFARGLYHVRPEDYQLVRRQGFNIVQTSPAHIDKCQEHGLKAAVALYRGMGINLDYYRDNLLKYRDHPAVACWMTMDEPAAHGVGLETMSGAYATIRRLVDQPAYTCICRPAAYTTYGRCTDIIAVDVYPIGKRPITAIADTLDIAGQNAAGHTIWFIGQVWSWPDTRLVTPREHRCMSYLALTHADVRGLFWYSFRDPDWYLPENNKGVWQMCGQVNNELIELEPVLLTGSIGEAVCKNNAGEVHYALKKLDKTLYLIATNPTEQACNLKVDLSSFGVGDRATDIFEKRTLSLVKGQLQDYFEPLDTRVYAVGLKDR
ncbi:MAG: hypothetical protein J7M40_13805 [Planctomycetes bacterium]|nr:hypothetical protein [Planctomycetota bacterium]